MIWCRIPKTKNKIDLPLLGEMTASDEIQRQKPLVSGHWTEHRCELRTGDALEQMSVWPAAITNQHYFHTWPDGDHALSGFSQEGT